jgi:redox-sensitive bicupin YhaK (pirin superfamily)
MSEHRVVEEVLVAREASDGDGVRLKRVFGGGDLSRFDPFLMLDEFGSEEAADYIGGFPEHPHRGFETVTYMLEGHMQHRDHMGNVGELKNGDVQWMTAGSGIIHSEMPQQKEGKMRGFQLWLNLASADKMQPPSYRDITASEIPVYRRDGVVVKVIAGELISSAETYRGALRKGVTEPIYLDVVVSGEAYSEQFDMPEGNSVLVYVYEGVATIDGVSVQKGRLVRLSRAGYLGISASAPVSFLVIAGKPLGEPIVQHGPFVMNSREEIETALTDFRNGTLAQRIVD